MSARGEAKKKRRRVQLDEKKKATKEQMEAAWQ
jgi:hypothetical protein